MTSVPLETLGTAGPQFSRLVAGCWRLHHAPDERAVDAFIDACLSLGITTFDHAAVYGNAQSEERFGQALRRQPSLRGRIQNVTKCGIVTPSLVAEAPHLYYDSGAGHIRWSVERSLRLLGLETVDLCLLHRPDHMMDVHETAQEMQRLAVQGKVRHWGVSNFNNASFDALQSVLDIPLVTNQIELSLLSHQPFTDGSMMALQARGVSAMAWSPLAGGALCNKTLDGLQPEALKATLGRLQQKHQVRDVSSLAIAWLLAHPAKIFPVIGSLDPANIKTAVDALEVKLSKPEWYELIAAAGSPPI